MKEYFFEYTDENYFLKLCGIMFVVTMVLLFMTNPISERIGLNAYLGLVFLILGVIYWTNRKPIKKNGSIILFPDSLKLSLHNSEKVIKLDDLKSYQIEETNGCILRLRFKDDEKLKILASDSFCDPNNLKSVCAEFEKLVQGYEKNAIPESKESNHFLESEEMEPHILPATNSDKVEALKNSTSKVQERHNAKIKKEKSIYERKWMPYFLTSITAVIVIYMILTMSDDKHTPGTIVSSIGIIISMWVAYFKQRGKNRKLKGANLT